MRKHLIRLAEKLRRATPPPPIWLTMQWDDPEEIAPFEDSRLLVVHRRKGATSLSYAIVRHGDVFYEKLDILAWAYLPAPELTLPPRYTAKDWRLLDEAEEILDGLARSGK